jgi:hypothetical protein
LKEGSSIQQAGNAVMWLIGISAVLVIVSGGLTFWSLIKREGTATTRGVKIASWIMACIASLFFFISGIP